VSSTNSQTMKPQFSILASIRADQARRGLRVTTEAELRNLEARAQRIVESGAIRVLPVKP
jgi:hypothetical protein